MQLRCREVSEAHVTGLQARRISRNFDMLYSQAWSALIRRNRLDASHCFVVFHKYLYHIGGGRLC